ncbi:RNA polymerase sigma factor [Terrimonas rubra]|uniref:RNA polymerase sigma factor n=1 Tax=Terrimonas rubra TaxID=1035890 RepID=A0ABW6ACS8_9BACT
MSTDNLYEERRLLLMLGNDSAYAFQQIFDKYKDHIYKVAMSYVKDKHLAEEIIQDVFTKVWTHRHSLLELRSFEAWLYTVSKNRIFDYNKKKIADWKAHLGYHSQKSETVNDSERLLQSKEYKELLHIAQQQLTDQQLLVFKLAKEEHMSYKQIAAQLNLSPLTVKTHLARAMNTLKNHLLKNGEINIFILLAIQNFF